MCFHCFGNLNVFDEVSEMLIVSVVLHTYTVASNSSL